MLYRYKTDIKVVHLNLHDLKIRSRRSLSIALFVVELLVLSTFGLFSFASLLISTFPLLNELLDTFDLERRPRPNGLNLEYNTGDKTGDNTLPLPFRRLPLS